MGWERSCLVRSAWPWRLYLELFVSVALCLSLSSHSRLTQWYSDVRLRRDSKDRCQSYHLVCLFFTDQNKVQADSMPPAFLRRNSFTPLSSQDQIKRPRLYSMGNPPQARLSQAPTLPSMQFSEASEAPELLQSEVSVVDMTIHLTEV